jgi:hypothetical protein
MDDVYDTYGIVLKTWFAEEGSESSYNVLVSGWSDLRRIIEKDGLISFQVTVHSQDRNCYTCKERVRFVKQRLADRNVQCFWTCDSDDDTLYVTIGPPPPQRPSPQMYLTFLLGLPVIRCSSPSQDPSKQTTLVPSLRPRFASSSRCESDNDAAISKAVKQNFLKDKAVNLTDVNVKTTDASVDLSGTVPSLEAREHAFKLAWRVAGVQSVVNHLVVSKQRQTKAGSRNRRRIVH